MKTPSEITMKLDLSVACQTHSSASRFGRASTVRALECGDPSPLSAGDLSPSKFGSASATPCASGLRQPRAVLSKSTQRDSDGDKSPAESGENSPHSITSLSLRAFTPLLALAFLFLAFAAPSHAAAPALQTRHVLLVMADGVRWQEVFTGAEEQLISKEHGGITKTNDVRKEFWRDTPEARHEALMPFFWSTLAKQGQLYGNQHKGSTAHVTNGKNFSYPGYSEILCGFSDPRIDSNAKKPNPNVTMPEWLYGKPAFAPLSTFSAEAWWSAPQN